MPRVKFPHSHPTLPFWLPLEKAASTLTDREKVPQDPPGRGLKDAERFQVAGDPGTWESRNFADGFEERRPPAEETLRARRHPDPPRLNPSPWAVSRSLMWSLVSADRLHLPLTSPRLHGAPS